MPKWIKVALTIGHWQLGTGRVFVHWAFGRTEFTPMVCLSDHQTTAVQCAIAYCLK